MEQIAWAAKAAGAQPLENPCRIEIVAVFPVPQSWSQAKQRQANAGTMKHAVRPDHDNLTKIVGDALNGVAWKDDCQIYDSHCIKKYCDFLLKEPHLSVWIDYDD